MQTMEGLPDYVSECLGYAGKSQTDHFIDRSGKQVDCIWYSEWSGAYWNLMFRVIKKDGGERAGEGVIRYSWHNSLL